MTKSARAIDKKNRRYVHFFMPFRYGVDPLGQELHVFESQKCWCNTVIQTDWSLMQTDKPYVFIYHQGAHGG